MKHPLRAALAGSKPKRDRPWTRRILFGVLAAILLIGSFYFDSSVARFVSDHQDSRLKTLGRFISHYGDWPQHALLGGVLLIIAHLMQSRRWQRIVLMMILASVLAGVTANAVRFATGRPRPSTHIPDGWYGPHTDYKHNAFPSGHTAASAGFFVVLLFVEWPIGVIALVFPVMVGLARIYVGAHHFSDIIGSVIIGVFSAYIALQMFKRYANQSQNRLET